MKMIPEETLISISHCQKSKFSISTQKAIPVMAEPFSFLLFLCESFGSSHRLIFRLYIINTLGSLLFFFLPLLCPELITKSPLTPPKLYSRGPWGEESACAILYIEQSLSPGSSRTEKTGAPLLSLFSSSSSSLLLLPFLLLPFSFLPSIFFFDIDVIAKERARQQQKKKNVRRRRRREYNRRHELAPPLDLFAESRNNSSKRRLVCLLAGPCPTNRPAQLSLSLDSFARVF